MGQGESLPLPASKKGQKSKMQYDLQTHLQNQNKEAPRSSSEDPEQQNTQQIQKIIDLKLTSRFNQLSLPLITDFKSKADKFPYSAVGILMWGENNFGTASIISKNLCITSAQNCYNSQKEAYHENLQFFPAPLVKQLLQSGHALRGMGFKIKQAYVPFYFQKKFNSSTQLIEAPLVSGIGVVQIQTQVNLQHYFGSLSYDFKWIDNPFTPSQELIDGLKMISFDKKQFKQYTFSCFNDNYFFVHNLPIERESSGAPILFIPFEGCVPSILGIQSLTLGDQGRAALKFRQYHLQKFTSSYPSQKEEDIPIIIQSSYYQDMIPRLEKIAQQQTKMFQNLHLIILGMVNVIQTYLLSKSEQAMLHLDVQKHILRLQQSFKIAYQIDHLEVKFTQNRVPSTLFSCTFLFKKPVLKVLDSSYRNAENYYQNLLTSTLYNFPSSNNNLNSHPLIDHKCFDSWIESIQSLPQLKRLQINTSESKSSQEANTIWPSRLNLRSGTIRPIRYSQDLA